MTGGASPRRVCVARIGAPHGVRGEVRLQVFARDPASLLRYAALHTEDGRDVRVRAMRPAKALFVATLDGVGDRDAAAGLTGQRLYVARDLLPATGEDEWYQADLIGLAVEDTAGRVIGEVIAVHDFGAGDLLDIRLTGGRSVMVPFVRDAVPVVDVAGGRIVVAPPGGLLDEPEPGADAADGA